MKIIALDVGGTKIKAGLVVNGQVNGVFSERTIKSNLNSFLGQIESIIKKLWSGENSAISLGLPSKLNPKKGEVFSTTNIPCLTDFNIIGYLSEVFHLPVKIHNDTVCFALGEYNYGLARNCQRVVGLTLGTGMGLAVIENGVALNLYHKDDIEFGERKYLDRTFEDYCCGKYFKYMYQKSSLQMQREAEKGDKNALEAFKRFGNHIKEALDIIRLEYKPDIIVFGGSVSNSFFLFQESFKEMKVKMEVSNNRNIALLGAAKLII